MKKYAPVNPVLRIPDIAIEPEFLANRGFNKFQAFQTDRADWVARREEFYLGWDDYRSDIRKGLWDGASNFHLPTTEIQCNVMHARILQSIFFVEPIFFIDPQEDVDAKRISKIQSFMKYIITRGCNYNRGLYNAIDDWAWDMTTDGLGILERDWIIEQRRFFDIERNPNFAAARLELDKMLSGTLDMDAYDQLIKEFDLNQFVEVEKVRTVFNGSMVSAIDPAYVLFKGLVVDATDLNLHDTVIKVEYLTKEQLLQFKSSGYMDEEAVDKVLACAPDIDGAGIASQYSSATRRQQDDMTGVNTVNPNNQEDRYEFLKVYDTVGLTSKAKTKDKIVYHLHTSSKELTRWTFLDRISSNGKINLHMGHLYRRPRRSIGRGMVETQSTSSEITDILINQAIDASLYQNSPMLKMKSGGAFDPGEFQAGPGVIVPVDDPLTDLLPINFNSNPSSNLGLMNIIQSYATQLTSMGPASTGQVAGRVGATRSTSGLNAMLAQADIQLDVIIRRVKQPISELFEGLYADNYERMPISLRIPLLGEEGIPIIGEDGAPIFEDISQDDLMSRVHFGLYANSNNMNKLAQEQNAQRMLQALIQPIALQTGTVSPENIYNLYDYSLSTMGVQNRHRYITKPKNLAPEDLQKELLAIAQGVMPRIVPIDPEHKLKAEEMQRILDSENTVLEVQYGKVAPTALELLRKAIKMHTDLGAMMEAPQALGNPTGDNMSKQAGKEPAMPEQAQQEQAMASDMGGMQGFEGEPGMEG